MQADLEFEINDEGNDFLLVTGIAHRCQVSEKEGKHSTYMSRSQIEKMASIPMRMAAAGKRIPMQVEHDRGKYGHIETAFVTDEGDLGVTLFLDKKLEGGRLAADAVHRGDLRELSSGLKSIFMKYYDQEFGHEDLKKAGVGLNEVSLVEKGDQEGCIITSTASSKDPGIAGMALNNSGESTKSEINMSNPEKTVPPVNDPEKKNDTGAPAGGSAPASIEEMARQLKEMKEMMEKQQAAADAQKRELEERVAQETQQRLEVERKAQIEKAMVEWGPRISEAKEAAKALAEMTKDERGRAAFQANFEAFEKYEKEPEMLLDDMKRQGLDNISSSVISAYGIAKAVSGHSQVQQPQDLGIPSMDNQMFDTEAGKAASGRQSDMEKELQRQREVIQRLSKQLSGNNSKPSQFDVFSHRASAPLQQQPPSSAAAPAKQEEEEDPEIEMFEPSNPLAFFAVESQASSKGAQADWTAFEKRGLVSRRKERASKARTTPYDPIASSKKYFQSFWRAHPRSGRNDFNLTSREVKQLRKEVKTGRMAQTNLQLISGHHRTHEVSWE